MIDEPKQLKKIEDVRGTLIVVETGKDIPFVVKRSYFIYGTSGDQPRGFHAHKALKQAFICVKGSCEVLLDNGTDKKTFKLDSPEKMLYVGPMVWREMHHFSADCIFLVYASDVYDESDYIREYKVYLDYVSTDAHQRGKQ